MYVTKQQMGPIGPAAHAGLTRERLFGSAQIIKKKGEVDVKTEIYPKILSEDQVHRNGKNVFNIRDASRPMRRTESNQQHSLLSSEPRGR